MFEHTSLENQIKTVSSNTFNMMIFEKLKTGNQMYDTVITTILLMSITYCLQFFNNIIGKIEFKSVFSSVFLNIFHKKSSIEYEGKITSVIGLYDSNLNQTSTFSDRFKALWQYIINDINENKSVRSLKEYVLTTHNTYNVDPNNDNNIYMVIQNETFLVSKELDIYAQTTINSETDKGDEKENNGKNRTSNKIEKIRIELFSYKSNVSQIKNFVESIKQNYLLGIADCRANKRFIYTLIQTKYEDSLYEMWGETVFSSTRTFGNIFFDNKQMVMNKLDFFINNKEWYFEKGIPYSLGIGMHGPPGTGKTSLIKAIANYTKRHVVIISLKLIKTKKQLDNIFFEERYNSDNKKKSITFDKKIIVFEDIDCVGDLLMDREKKKNKVNNGLGKILNMTELSMNSKVNVGDLLETIAANDNDKSNTTVQGPKLPTDESPITLDDILNLWDGIRETPGRIMIISSNHYYDLDPAVIRPGRIDITLELSYASHQVIREVYTHLFKESIDEDLLMKITPNFYSPAELMNIYMNENRNSQKFMERLIQNKHV